jgi:putative transposase
VFDPERRRRASLRLQGYDYTQAGLYFVTICVQDRVCLFGDVVDGEMRLSKAGEVVAEEWARTAEIRPTVVLDAFVIMPNHLHGIVMLVDVDADGRILPPRPVVERTGMSPRGPVAGSLSAIVGQFKAVTTKGVNAERNMPGVPVWQRGFHDQIIRHERALARIRDYVADNPALWDADRLHPAAPPWQPS